MPQFAALLRGVNVGKANRVPMGDFKLALQGHGYRAVVTLLNSGNAVFSSSTRSANKHSEAIAEILHGRFSVTVPVIVKPAAEFSAVLSEAPMTPDDTSHGRFLIAFAQSPESLRSAFAALPAVQSSERIAMTDRAIYLHCTQGLLQSKVAEALLGKAGRNITTRNWATALKLRALLDAG